MATRRRLIIAGAWVIGLAAVATTLFDALSFGLAHANLILVAVYLPYWPAARGLIPPMNSLPIVFIYEALYFLAIALAVIVVKSFFERRARHGQPNAP